MSEMDELGFRSWYVPMAMKLGIDPNPDSPQHFYDYRSFYRDMQGGVPGVISPDQPGGHFPSTYKTAGHPRTYLDDPATGRTFDTRSAQYLGGEPVGMQALRASEESPDKPDFKPESAFQALAAIHAAGRMR